MTEKKLGPWPLGMDNLSTDENMPRDQFGRNVVAMRDALNFDFTRDGWIDTRPGLQRLLTSLGLHSLWRAGNGNWYGGHGNHLVRVQPSGGSLQLVTLATLPSASPIDFDMLLNEVVFTTREYLGVIDRLDNVRPLAVPDVEIPAAVAAPGGGFEAARYSIAMSRLNARGEEGGLSPIRTLTLNEGEGIRITLPSGDDAVRIYRTGPNGKELRRVADVPLAMGTFLLGKANTGRLADTWQMRAMRPGDFVRYWMGTLLVARGRFIYRSAPLRYGLTDPRHRFMEFPYRIAFLEAMDGGGIYVGLVGYGTKYIQPDFTLDDTTTAPPFPGSSVRVPRALFDPDAQVSGEVAVWLTENGYVMGRENGNVSEPQSQRIRLPPAAYGRTAVLGRRLITIVNN